MPKFFSQPLIPDYSTRIAYTAANLQEYIGEARPGAKDSDAFWRIQKITYSSGLMTHRMWANNTAEFDKVWNERTTYDYTP